MSEYRVSFCEMSMGWPLQYAHPEGANWKPRARISPTNGWDMKASPQLRLGNTPANAMQKLMQSDGIILVCAWLLPTVEQVAGANVWGMSGGCEPTGGLAYRVAPETVGVP